MVKYLRTKYSDTNNFAAWISARGLIFNPRMYYTVSPFKLKWKPSTLSFIWALIMNAIIIIVPLMAIFYFSGTDEFNVPDVLLLLLLTGVHLLLHLLSAGITHHKVMLARK